MESIPSDTTPLKKPIPVRPASIRYIGFECTSEGRAYRLRVDGVGEPRLFTVTIPNAAFDVAQGALPGRPGAVLRPPAAGARPRTPSCPTASSS